MNLAELFDCTFVINLPDRKDRRAAISRELGRAGVPLKPGKVEIFRAIRPTEAAGFPSPGVRGCFLSHLGILREARKRNLKSVLILEDDLVMSPLLGKSIDSLKRALEQQPWGLVYFGHVEKVGSPAIPALVPFAGAVMTTHFYGVSGAALERLIDFLQRTEQRQPGDPAGGPMHVDGALTMFRHANPDLLTLIAHPNLGWQRPSRSDIHSTWYQHAPVFRQAYDLARTVRSVLREHR